MKVIEDLLASLASLLMLFFIFLIATFPVTWLLMLFLGNLGTGLSYWGTLPPVRLGGRTGVAPGRCRGEAAYRIERMEFSRPSRETTVSTGTGLAKVVNA